MKNITLSAEESLIEAARARALGADDSERGISPLVGQLCPDE
jgi:hypothetical protein